MSESKEPKPVSEFTEEQREWFRINKKYEHKLQPFFGKSMALDSPECKEYEAIEQERDAELNKFRKKYCKPEPIDTLDKLSKWIDQELVTLDMIKMVNRGEFPSERAKESYQKVREYALKLRISNPDLLSLPAPPKDTEVDSKIPFQSIKEWCIDARTERNAAPAKIIIKNFQGVLGDVNQPENLQIGDNARIQKYSKIKKVGIIGTVAALLTILHLLGLLEPIKNFIVKMIWHN